ncbi:MAG: hypothetical protein HYV07_00940 [Deltaproteobacteria bacterium]|nr:hypothetical protein [Deltaproteobacteria bacterium]
MRYLAALAALFAQGCTSSSDGCRTTADCAESGSAGLTCVDGACVHACSVDSDCEEVGADYICEARICVPGCPATACVSGQVCTYGRCAFFYEGFEADRIGEVATLEALGWNPNVRELRNEEAIVVYNREGCTIEDEESKCAGTPAEGSYYLSIERTPTPPTGTEEFGVTCGSCRCCLECRDAARRNSASQRVYYHSNAGTPPPGCGNGTVETSPSCADEPPPGTRCEQCDDGNTTGGDGCSPACRRELAECPGVNAVADMCTADVDSACADICSACDACPNANAGAIGDGLTSCETDAALKSCSACLAYEACIAANPTNPEACEETQRPCIACREADRLTIEVPDQPSVWREWRQICDSQSLGDRCYATQVARPRSALTEDEQAVESPKISIAGVSGDLVLEFQYLAFNIGDSYRPVDQTKPKEEWPLVTQEVEIQLCGGNCAAPESWKPATFTTSAPAKFPTGIEKNNGLFFANQNRTDWRANLREALIPAELRTTEFQFRFLPRLADGARVGVDAVAVRERR